MSDIENDQKILSEYYIVTLQPVRNDFNAFNVEYVFFPKPRKFLRAYASKTNPMNVSEILPSILQKENKPSWNRSFHGGKVKIVYNTVKQRTYPAFIFYHIILIVFILLSSSMASNIIYI